MQTAAAAEAETATPTAVPTQTVSVAGVEEEVAEEVEAVGMVQDNTLQLQIYQQSLQPPNPNHQVRTAVAPPVDA